MDASFYVSRTPAKKTTQNKDQILSSFWVDVIERKPCLAIYKAVTVWSGFTTEKSLKMLIWSLPITTTQNVDKMQTLFSLVFFSQVFLIHEKKHPFQNPWHWEVAAIQRGVVGREHCSDIFLVLLCVLCIFYKFSRPRNKLAGIRIGFSFQSETDKFSKGLK